MGDNQTRPDKNTFSLDDFIQKKATTPVIKHRVFVDNESGMRRAEIDDEISTLEKDLKKLEAQRDLVSSKKSTGISEAASIPDKIAALEKRIEGLNVEHDKLTAAILDGSMIFELSWTSMEGPKTVISEARDKWCEDHGIDAADWSATKNMTNKQQESMGNFISCALVAAATRRVTYPSGEVSEGNLTVEQVNRLVNDHLILSEKEKLFAATNKSAGSGDDWFNGIDAGFPS